MSELDFLPEDAALPGLSELFAQEGPPQHVAEVAVAPQAHRLTGTCERTYTRYWPGRRCVVQWTLDTTDGLPLIVSAELLSEREARKGRTGTGWYLEAQRTWVEVFPHDRVLTAIEKAVSEDWVRRTLLPALGPGDVPVSTEVISYKSWRRCVIRYTAGGRRYYGKLFRDERGAELAERLEGFRAALAAAGAPLVTPETVFYDAETGMLVQAELPEGRSLSALLTLAPDDAEARRQLLQGVEQSTQVLSLMQALEQPGLERFSVEDAIEALRDDVADIASVEAAVGAELQRRLDALAETAVALTPEPLVPTHSAFRHSHLYLTAAGPGLLDLDNLRLAGASSDAGYFLAYLQYSGIRRKRLRDVLDECTTTFLKAWKEQPNYHPDWLLFHAEYVLLKWSIRSFFSLDPRWRDVMRRAASRVAHLGEAVHSKHTQVQDPLLAIAGRQRVLQKLAEETIAGQFWPDAEAVSLEDIDVAYDPGEQVVALASLNLQEHGIERNEQVIITFKPQEHFAEAAQLARAAGGGQVLVAENQYIAERFPNDYLLPGLARGIDDGHMLHLLKDAGVIPGEVASFDHQVLRYRPHERCVVRYRLTDQSGGVRQFVAKVYDDEETTREVWATLRSLRAQLADPVLVVEPVAVDTEHFIVVMENIEGERVGDLMDETTDLETSRRFIDMTADALAGLHALTLDHDRVKTFATEIAKLRSHERSAGSVSEEMGVGLRDALDAIEARARHLNDAEPGFVHGGFKPTQMLLRPNGKVTVVDFDGSCIGDPAIDVGRFMAKTRVDCLEPTRAHLQGLDQYFLDSYSARSRRDVRDRARIYQAMALVRMASRRFETRIASFQRSGLEGGPSGVLLREALHCLSL